MVKKPADTEDAENYVENMVHNLVEEYSLEKSEVYQMVKT